MTDLPMDFGEWRQRVLNLDSAINKLSGDIGQLTKQVTESGRTQWPILFSLLSLTIVILSGLGFVTLQPLKDQQATLSQDLRVIVREQLVPRQEISERWLANARDFDNVRQRIVLEVTNLQRQVDTLSNKYTDIYSAPQALRDITERIRQLESQRNWATAVEKR